YIAWKLKCPHPLRRRTLNCIMQLIFRLSRIKLSRTAVAFAFLAFCFALLYQPALMSGQAAAGSAQQSTAPSVASQNPATPVQAADKPSISLSPAVVMAKGSFSQTLSQTLTLTNQTARDFAFDMVAEDVVIKDG